VFRIGFDQTVGERVFDRGQDDRCRRLFRPVKFDDLGNIQIAEDVAVEDDGRFADIGGGIFISAARAHRVRFGDEAKIDVVIGAVAEQIFDLIRLVA
jgi:hypothetical protein